MGFSFRYRKHPRDLVDAVQLAASERHRPCPKRPEGAMRRRRVCQPGTERVVDDSLEALTALAADSGELHGYVIIYRDGRTHGITSWFT
jgi:hypothetical protein